MADSSPTASVLGAGAIRRLWEHSGIPRDVRQRWPWYTDDWREGLSCGLRIFAPSTFIFFASAIPALAFGEQLARETDGIFSGVHTLAASSITGVIQAIVGGQPLLIVGVSEPIALIYGYMYRFAKDRPGLGSQFFLPWATWTCIWAALMIGVLALAGSCRLIDRFTRMSGELFGMLIAILFMQEAVKGVVNEFHRDTGPGAASGEAATFPWRVVNGLWSLILALGLLLTAWYIRGARRWKMVPGKARGFLADYGVPILVAVWSGVSYALRGAPAGVPRRLILPNTWDVRDTWSVAKELGNVSGTHIATAIVPGAIIAVLFYFDHNVSSQMAQQPDFNLRKPPAYNCDMLLLAIMTLLCGLIGLPPVNGVLPQAPMHTKSLASLKRQVTDKAHKARSRILDRNGVGAPATNGKAAAGSLHGSPAGIQLTQRRQPGGDRSAEVDVDRVLPPTGEADGEAREREGKRTDGVDVEAPVRVEDEHMPVEVLEQRVSNLIQSLLIAACLAITPALRRIPNGVLWGFFAFMAMESLPGSEFWERTVFIVSSRSYRRSILLREHHPFFETVPARVIVLFTLFQLLYTAAVYAITWIPIAGILFPLPIMLLVLLRQFLLPRLFSRSHLSDLDAASYEEAPPVPPEVLDAEEAASCRRRSSASDMVEEREETTAHEWPRFEIKHHIPEEAMVSRRLSDQAHIGSGQSQKLDQSEDEHSVP